MSQTPQDLPPELLDVVRALEEQGPRLTESELARARRRATQARSPRAATRLDFLRGGVGRSRIAIVAVLAAGGLMTSGGAALGISALSTDLSAKSAQYGQPAPQAPAAGSANPAISGPGGVEEAQTLEGAASDGEQGAAGPGGEADTAVQPARQLEAAAADKLPFTGFAAIPLLLVGLALLASGLVLRRKDRPLHS